MKGPEKQTTIELAAARQQVEQIRSWGIAHGLPFEQMFCQEVDFPVIWYLDRARPDGSEFNTDYFADNPNGIKKRRSELTRQGFDTYASFAEAYGSASIPLLTSLLRDNEIRRAYVMFHEAIHVWLEQRPSLGRILLEPTEESLADYLGLELMILWLSETYPEKLTSGLEYRAIMEMLQETTESVAQSIRLHGAKSKIVLQEKAKFAWIISSLREKFKVYHPPKDYSDKIAKPEDVNGAVIGFYRRYSLMYSPVQRFFKNGGLDPRRFLADYKKYETNLHNLQQTVLYGRT